jgi:hypothetical protein
MFDIFQMLHDGSSLCSYVETYLFGFSSKYEYRFRYQKNLMKSMNSKLSYLENTK